MKTLEHRFVEYIPEQIEEGVLYISIQYRTASHMCICGCGNRVYTPITPTDWKMTFDGKSVTIYPSIGNWNFPCQSHYWIVNNQIKQAYKWSDKQIKEERKKEAKQKKRIYKKRDANR
jgi:hypothetical protein